MKSIEQRIADESSFANLDSDYGANKMTTYDVHVPEERNQVETIADCINRAQSDIERAMRSAERMHALARQYADARRDALRDEVRAKSAHKLITSLTRTCVADMTRGALRADKRDNARIKYDAIRDY